jgi:hypothetical protein
MPQLIAGHLRYTDDDYLLHEFQEKVCKQSDSNDFNKLNEVLRDELSYLNNLKDEILTEKFDTTKNIKNSLSKSLLILMAIANKEGYSINDIMNN